MGGFANDVLVASNVNFTGLSGVAGKAATISTNGEMIIGSTALNAGGTHINIGTLTSPSGTLTIGYSSPNITIDLAGGSTGIDSIQVDTTTGAGTNPVLPTGAGLITITGGQYPSATFGTRVITLVSTAANKLEVQVQRSAAAAAADENLNGVAHFDSASFAVSNLGFVTASGTGLGKTITGDSGGALSPTAGNWNILGLAGSKTSGSGSTLTVKSPPFSQVGASATSSLNTGEFVTAAVTRTLPASAGLADGDLFIYVCTTAGALVIQSVAAQKIRLGSSITGAAGSLTSTAIGDSVTLRFNATDGFFYAVSSIGNWTVSP